MTVPANEQDVAVTNQGQKQTPSQPNFFIPLDTSWFDREPERYLEREDFREFQEVSAVDFRRLMSMDRETVNQAQEEMAIKCVLFNEVRNIHFGFSFPFIIYTHDFNFSVCIPNHNPELDIIVMALDMCDSLRRRHLCLSHAIIPQVVNDLYQSLGRPVTIKNLGAGAGLGTLTPSSTATAVSLKSSIMTPTPRPSRWDKR